MNLAAKITRRPKVRAREKKKELGRERQGGGRGHGGTEVRRQKLNQYKRQSRIGFSCRICLWSLIQIYPSCKPRSISSNLPTGFYRFSSYSKPHRIEYTRLYIHESIYISWLSKILHEYIYLYAGRNYGWVGNLKDLAKGKNLKNGKELKTRETERGREEVGGEEKENSQLGPTKK